MALPPWSFRDSHLVPQLLRELHRDRVAEPHPQEANLLGGEARGLGCELTRDLPGKAKVPPGLLQIQVTGAAPFGEDTVLIHVTQYFGTRRRPKAAMVLPAVYRGDDV